MVFVCCPCTGCPLNNRYQAILPTVQLWGPTNFAPVINQLKGFAAAAHDSAKRGSVYFVLVILTDGVRQPCSVASITLLCPPIVVSQHTYRWYVQWGATAVTVHLLHCVNRRVEGILFFLPDALAMGGCGYYARSCAHMADTAAATFPACLWIGVQGFILTLLNSTHT